MKTIDYDQMATCSGMAVIAVLEINKYRKPKSKTYVKLLEKHHENARMAKLHE